EIQPPDTVPAALALAAAGAQVLALVAPEVVDGPLPAHVDLLALAPLQSVGGADHAVVARVVARAYGFADRAARLRVVLDRGVDAPLRRPVDGSAEQDVGQPLADRRLAGQGHALVLEAQPLRHAETRRLGPDIGVEQPGAGTEREQVAVRNPVVAAERVFGVDGGEIEIVV